MESNTKKKIVLFEREEKTAKDISKLLKESSFSVYTVCKNKEFYDALKKESIHLILLDIDLKDKDGIEICWDLKSEPKYASIPVVFYAQKGEEYTQIAAFDAGAEDFIVRTVKQRLFLARIKALMKRCYPEEQKVAVEANLNIRKFGNVEIDEEQVTVYKKGEPLALSKKEFEIIILLSSKPGAVFKRNAILKKIWGDDIIVGDRNIDTHIKKLRKKIGKSYIQTIRGIGYKFQPKNKEEE